MPRILTTSGGRCHALRRLLLLAAAPREPHVRLGITPGGIMQSRKLWYFAALMIALLGSGCVTSGAVASRQDLAVTLEIENNLPGLIGISTFIVTETGARRSLGPINSNQRQAFE